jgi:hypothetical protein
VSPVKYELGFYIPEDDIFHSHAVKTSNLTRGRQFNDEKADVTIRLKIPRCSLLNTNVFLLQ